MAPNTAFTGKDNASVDIGRVLLAVSVGAVICLEGFVVIWRGQAFDAATFAVALGGLLVGGCGALHLKRETEPDPEPPRSPQ